MNANPAGRKGVLLAAGLLLAACGGGEKDGGSPGRLEAGVLQSPSTTALSNQGVARAVRTVLAETLEVPVRIQADERAGIQVTAPAAGRLEAVRIRTAAQAVSAGETLALLYSPELVTAQREHLLLDPEGEAGLFRQSKERLRRMGLTSAQIRTLRATGKPLDRIPIRSPRSGFLLLGEETAREAMAMPPSAGPGPAAGGMDGSMGGMGGGAMSGPGSGGAPAAASAESGFRAGAYVARGQALARVNPLTTVAAVLSLPVGSAALFREGDSVHLELPSVPWRGMARLDFLEARVADTGGNVEARAHLANPGFRLRPGAHGKAHLAPRADSAWVLPRAAVHGLGERHMAWVRSTEDTGVFQAREVRIGRAGARHVEILEGLAPGEAVAANASLLVDPDVMLEPLPLPAAGAGDPAGHGAHGAPAGRETASPDPHPGYNASAGAEDAAADSHAGHDAPPARKTAASDPHTGHGDPGNGPSGSPTEGHGTHASRSAPDSTPAVLRVAEAEAERAGVRVAAAAEAHLVPSRVFRAVTRFDDGSRETIPARVEGRIEDVAVLRPGEKVAQGQVLASLRSETLQSAQEEYLAARRMAAGLASPDLVKAQLQAARRRLQVLGMNAGQVAALERAGRPSPLQPVASPRDGILLEAQARPGQYVTEGQALFAVGASGRIWVETWLLASEAADFPEGTVARVRVEGLPGDRSGRLEHVRRETALAGSAVLAHVSVPDSGGRILPGMQAWVTLTLPGRHSLAVPPSALLRSSQGAMAWVRTGPGAYAPRMVRTGLETPAATEILEGLRAGDSVVVSGAYLLNSEWSYRRGAGQVHAGH